MQTNHAQDAQGAQQVKSMVTVLHPNINYNRKESPFIVFRFFSSIFFITVFWYSAKSSLYIFSKSSHISMLLLKPVDNALQPHNHCASAITLCKNTHFLSCDKQKAAQI
jgi:hypothetical protein